MPSSFSLLPGLDLLLVHLNVSRVTTSHLVGFLQHLVHSHLRLLLSQLLVFFIVLSDLIHRAGQHVSQLILSKVFLLQWSVIDRWSRFWYCWLSLFLAQSLIFNLDKLFEDGARLFR